MKRWGQERTEGRFSFEKAAKQGIHLKGGGDRGFYGTSFITCSPLFHLSLSFPAVSTISSWKADPTIGPGGNHSLQGGLEAQAGQECYRYTLGSSSLLWTDYQRLSTGANGKTCNIEQDKHLWLWKRNTRTSVHPLRWGFQDKGTGEWALSTIHPRDHLIMGG